MPRHYQGASLQTLTLGLLLTALSTLAFADTVRLTNGDWLPYLSRTPPHGEVSQIIAAAFAHEDVSVTWGFFPWSRSYILARDGRWDGSAAWSCTRERFRDFYFSEAIEPIRYVFFHLSDRTFEWDDMADLKGLRIGLTQDYSYGPALEEAAQKGWFTTDTTTSDEVNFRKLLAGRIDVFPMDIRAGLALIQKSLSVQQATRLTYHPRVLHAANLHLILSRKVAGNQALMQRFNSGLQAVRDTGQPESANGATGPSAECLFDLQTVAQP